MLRAAPIAAALALILPGAAHADWGWTHWDSNRDQVVEGSKRKVKAVAGRPGQRVNGWDLRAGGKIVEDGLKMRAEFFFDPDGRQLHVVKLSPRLADCPALRKILTDRYGTPRDRSFTIPSSNPIRVTVLAWRDEANGNYVAYSENGQIGKLKPGCFVRYRPFSEPDPDR